MMIAKTTSYRHLFKGYMRLMTNQTTKTFRHWSRSINAATPQGYIISLFYKGGACRATGCLVNPCDSCGFLLIPVKGNYMSSDKSRNKTDASYTTKRTDSFTIMVEFLKTILSTLHYSTTFCPIDWLAPPLFIEGGQPYYIGVYYRF